MVVEPATDEALVSSNVNGKKVEQKLIPLHSTPERIPDANESIDTDDEHTPKHPGRSTQNLINIDKQYIVAEIAMI